ncbi:unnamed protein product [Ixodes pacificus]
MSPLHNLLYRWKHGSPVDSKSPILKENEAKHKGKKAGPLSISVTGSPSFPVGSAERRVPMQAAGPSAWSNLKFCRTRPPCDNKGAVFSKFLFSSNSEFFYQNLLFFCFKCRCRAKDWDFS